MGWLGGAVVGTITSQQEGHGFEPTSLYGVYVLLVSVWVSSWYASFLLIHWFPPTLQTHAD